MRHTQDLGTAGNLREEDLDSSAETEHAEGDEHFPGDVRETGWNKKTQGEVEQPVSDGGDTLRGFVNMHCHSSPMKGEKEIVLPFQ